MNSDIYGGERAGTQGTSGEAPKRSIAELAEDVKRQASDVAKDVTSQVKEQASRLAEDAKGSMSGASDKVLSAVEEQKNAGADFISGIAGAVRRAAGEFEGQIPHAGDYIRRAADQIDGASDAIRQRDLRELLQGVQDLARRQPTAFLGASVLAGFAVVRLLKSSAPSKSPARNSRAYQSENERHLAGAGSRYTQDQRL